MPALVQFQATEYKISYAVFLILLLFMNFTGDMMQDTLMCLRL